MLLRTKNGFITIQMLSVSSVLIACIFALGAVLFLIQNREQNHYLCHNYLMQIMAEHARSLDELFLLNPRAMLLETNHKIAIAKKVAAIGAGNAPAAAAAQAEIELIEMQQIQLQTNQQKIFTQLKIKSQNLLLRWKLEFRSKNKVVSSLNVSERPLQVIPQFKSIAPAYKTNEPIRQLQEWQARWRSVVKNKSIPGQCNASVIKEDLQWQPALTKAKF